ncbi:hypothetical protein PIB30_004596 [Stylosanthes scabra]|uniref:Uncharacterized protein n=1 Tax=Stylosanthes scabra TaxID=79078 RepID=A0ABU6Z3E8_9FABA|nr:hypothetical protein [Stylosanthes scabra]
MVVTDEEENQADHEDGASYDRNKELKLLDDTKAGVKGLSDAVVLMIVNNGSNAKVQKKTHKRIKLSRAGLDAHSFFNSTIELPVADDFRGIPASQAPTTDNDDLESLKNFKCNLKPLI